MGNSVHCSVLVRLEVSEAVLLKGTSAALQQYSQLLIERVINIICEISPMRLPLITGSDKLDYAALPVLSIKLYWI